MSEGLKTFREAFCERFNIRPDLFGEKVLWRCHHRRSLPLGRWIWRHKRAHYDADLDMIRAVAECTSVSELRAEMNDFLYHNPPKGFLRKTMHVRLSGQRLVDMAAKIMY